MLGQTTYERFYSIKYILDIPKIQIIIKLEVILLQLNRRPLHLQEKLGENNPTLAIIVMTFASEIFITKTILK